MSAVYMISTLTSGFKIVLALLLLILPGIPLASLWRPNRGPGAFAGIAVLTGLATYVVAFWLLRWLPAGLLGLVFAVTAVACAGMLASRARLLPFVRSFHRHLAAVAAIAIATLTLRCLPMLLAPVAPGADMSMHSAVTRIITEADGVPTSYRPYVPVDSFGANPAGLSILAAMISRLSGVHPVRSTFVMACLSHALLTLALFVFLRRRFGGTEALAAAVLVTFVARDPQSHFLWGGDPTVLSLAFIVASLSVLENLDLRPPPGRTLGASILVAAAILTHPVIPYATALALAALYLCLAAAKGWRRLESAIPAAALVTVTLGILLAPFLVHWDPGFGPGELAWIRAWQLRPEHVPQGKGAAVLLDLLPFLVRRLGALFWTWSAFALAGLVALRRKLPARELVLGGVAVLLVFNAYAWLLPASYVLYPDRVILLLVVPAGTVIAQALRAVRALKRSSLKLGRRIPVRPALVAACLLVSLPMPFARWYLAGVRQVSVTGDDLEAMAWIVRYVDPSTVIGTNYGDAGPWIPALIGRPVTSPHYHILHADEVKAWRAGMRPDVVFVGSRRVYEGIQYRRQNLLKDAIFEEAFRSGNASVFIRRPATGDP